MGAQSRTPRCHWHWVGLRDVIDTAKFYMTPRGVLNSWVCQDLWLLLNEISAKSTAAFENALACKSGAQKGELKLKKLHCQKTVGQSWIFNENLLMGGRESHISIIYLVWLSLQRILIDSIFEDLSAWEVKSHDSPLCPCKGTWVDAASSPTPSISSFSPFLSNPPQVVFYFVTFHLFSECCDSLPTHLRNLRVLTYKLTYVYFYAPSVSISAIYFLFLFPS